MSVAISKNELARRRFSIVVQYVQNDFDSGPALEQHGNAVAKSDVLSPLADIEGEFGFSLTPVAAEKLDDPVFDFQTREARVQRAAVKP